MRADAGLARELYRWMVLARAIDRVCCELSPAWFPGEGEEAVVVGAFYGMRPEDTASPHYRSPFVAYLMRGASLERLLGQVLGRANGYTRGRIPPFSGPVELGFIPWVGGDLGPEVSIATGAALEAWYRRTGSVAICAFGDGTANRGDVHEAMNLAAVLRLPVVYVCQNNQYSISLHGSKVVAGEIVNRAAGYGMPGVAVDGNDVLAVHEAVQAAVARARAGDGPSLVEARTYRLKGHWAADLARYRPEGEAESWRARDPIARLAAELEAAGALSAAEAEAVQRQAVATVQQALEAARAQPEAGAAGLHPEEMLV